MSREDCSKLLSDCAHHLAGSDENPWLDRLTTERARTAPRVLIVDADTHARIDRSSLVQKFTSRLIEEKSKSPSCDLVWQTHLVLNATESLERAQRVRLDRVVEDWEAEFLPLRLPAPVHRKRASLGRRLAEWLRGRRRAKESPEVLLADLGSRLLEFDSYLLDAHRHEAVIRRSARGSRKWFADWRRHALAALRLGISPRELVELLRSAPVAASVRRAPTQPARRHDADFAGLRERLANVIFPNAPGAVGAFRDLPTGDGLAAARI